MRGASRRDGRGHLRRCRSRPGARSPGTRCSASSRAAMLSGLLPERAKCTTSIGSPAASVLAGLATMSVLAMAVACRPRRASAGARQSPMKEEVPAPVNTIRRAGLASNGARKERTKRRLRRCGISGHKDGCWAISRAVHSAPAAWAARVCPASEGNRSPLIFRVSCTARRGRARTCVRRRCTRSRCRSSSDQRLSRRPGQQRVAVEVGACDGVGQVLALGVDLEAGPEVVVQAGRHPVEGVGDRRPAGHIGALRAAHGEARLVIPVDVRAQRSLLVEHADGLRGRRRGIDRADVVAELVVAAGASWRCTACARRGHSP